VEVPQELAFALPGLTWGGSQRDFSGLPVLTPTLDEQRRRGPVRLGVLELTETGSIWLRGMEIKFPAAGSS